MTHHDERLKTVADAVRRKNTLEAPVVRPVTLEVRTALGFSLKGDDVQALLADRKGANAFHVVWEYKVRTDRLMNFSFALKGSERDLFEKTASGAVRYLGTYVIREDPAEIPVFVTTWGCNGEADARTVARGPWKGPAGAEQAFQQIFSPDFFNYGKARITTQGLAAAADLSSDE